MAKATISKRAPRLLAALPGPLAGRAARPLAGAGALLLCAAAASGCLEFRRGESKTADNVVDTHQDLVRAPASDEGVVDLAATVLTVTAAPRCDMVEMEKVEQTTSYERKFDDDSVVPIAVLEVMSLVPMIAGVALLADSPKVYDNDPNQRDYNPTGKTAVVNAGAALLSVGAVVNIWPTVELIRSAVPEKDTTTMERQGDVLQRNVDCANRFTASGHYVTLRHAGGTISLGSTDGNGKLATDLKQVLPLSLFQSPNPPVSMGVWLDSQYLGDVGVAQVGMALLAQREEQDDLAWRAAEPEACAAGRTEAACAGVRRYQQGFPQGRHASEATQLVNQLAVAPPPNGGVKIATDTTAPLLDRAVAESQAASQKAMDAVWSTLEQDTKKAEQQAEKDAVTAGHTACIKTCRQVCAADGACRKSCEEQCP
ncbi:MAG: hypothetical protein IT373_09840 [Polyangiaceae bacterium]|nr:hypothetical protein [Polyangiaceae bacterium]